jgi:hypothetical protein
MPRVVLVLLGGLVLALAVAVAPATAANNVPANVKLCKDFEFVYQGIPLTVYVRSDGTTFANYADCVQYSARGGTVIRRSQFVCESFGGTYIWQDFAQTTFGVAIWTCRNFTVTGDESNFIDNFSSPCVADALAAGFDSASTTWTVIDLAGSGNVMECRGLGEL